MAFLKTSIKTDARCHVCGKPLIVNGFLVADDCHKVLDVLETTTNNDAARTYIPLLPPFYFCSEHVRENNTYYLQENFEK